MFVLFFKLCGQAWLGVLAGAALFVVLLVLVEVIKNRRIRAEVRVALYTPQGHSGFAVGVSRSEAGRIYVARNWVFSGI